MLLEDISHKLHVNSQNNFDSYYVRNKYQWVKLAMTVW